MIAGLFSEINLINKSAERELPFYINVSRNLEPSEHRRIIEDAEDEIVNECFKCSVELVIKPLNKNDIQSIQVTFIAQSPLVCSDPNQAFTIILDEMRTKTDVFIGNELSIANLEVVVVVLFINSLRNVRVLNKTVRLPLKLVSHPVRPLKESKYKVTLSTDKPPVELMDLFKGTHFEDNFYLFINLTNVYTFANDYNMYFFCRF